MEDAYWQTRWQRGETGFHLPRPHPKLVTLWPTFAPDFASPVFVPLCGKSLDMVWLAERGHAVIGVELSELAVTAFFAEQGLVPDQQQQGALTRFSAGHYTIYCGDFFSMSAEHVAGCEQIYDRAALIALPAPLREAYVQHLRSMLPKAQLLLITLVYLQHQMAGPPFSVPPEEVAALFADANRVQLMDHDILSHEPRFAAKGVTALREQVWRLSW
ncbi:MAG TPA: thiopurine S-methyltransferase [Permianibacter sp.]|nr:thiopurine S-methyltransferase [Permianibacter sp.]